MSLPYAHGWLVRQSETVIKADQDLWRADRAVEAALAMPEDERWETLAIAQRRAARRRLREAVEDLANLMERSMGEEFEPRTEDAWVIFAYRVRMQTLGFPDRGEGIL